MFMQLLLVDGATNICWSRDLHFPLFFILASLDRVFALTFSPLDYICWTNNCCICGFLLKYLLDKIINCYNDFVVLQIGS